MGKTSSVYPVTYNEHYTYQNEKKRLIGVPIGRLVEFFTQEFKEKVAYNPNPELDNEGNKHTPLSPEARYLRGSFYKKNTSGTGGIITYNILTSQGIGGVAGTAVAAVSDTITTTTTSSGTTSTTTTYGSTSSSSSSRRIL